MNQKKKIEEYDLFNDLSDEWWNEDGKFKVLHQIQPLRIQYIKEQIKDNSLKNLDILDVGCGGGLICEPLARLEANVTGIDFVRKNIKAAQEHAKSKSLKINYKCQDIENINFDKKYDLIIIFEVLEHLDDWRNFIIRIKENLKSNGQIIISTINRNLISKYLVNTFKKD